MQRFYFVKNDINLHFLHMFSIHSSIHSFITMQSKQIIINKFFQTCLKSMNLLVDSPVDLACNLSFYANFSFFQVQKSFSKVFSFMYRSIFQKFLFFKNSFFQVQKYFSKSVYTLFRFFLLLGTEVLSSVFFQVILYEMIKENFVFLKPVLQNAQQISKKTLKNTLF